MKVYHLVRTKRAFTEAVWKALKDKTLTEEPSRPVMRNINKGLTGEPWIDPGSPGFMVWQVAQRIGFGDPPLELIATITAHNDTILRLVPA